MPQRVNTSADKAQPFDIPEILSLICQHARRSDLARLMSTSRNFFDCALPIVWYSLPGHAPKILMKLLPGGDKYLNFSSNPAVADILQPLDAQSLGRFNLYTPHVRRILLAQSLQEDSIPDRLLALVNSRPILPKLEVLDIAANVFRKSGVSDPQSYIEFYCSPTLVEVNYVHVEHFPVPTQILYELLSRVVQECPRISSLRLGDIGYSLLDLMYHPNGLAHFLRQLNNLQVLGIGPIALDPEVLAAIGNLPKLESLELDEEGKPGTSLELEDLPPAPSDSYPKDSFTILRRLKLITRAGPGLIGSVWNVTPLVRRLESVSITMNASVSHTQVPVLVRLIRQNSPFISDLELNFSGSWHYVNVLEAEIIDHLSQLPLRRLYLANHETKFEPQRCSGEQLALAFPNMEDLQIRGHDFTFSDLTFIARYMPKLRYLSVSIRAGKDWPSEYKGPSALTPSSSKLCFCFPLSHSISTLSKATSSSTIEKIAIGLHSLWPNGVICEDDPRSRKVPKMNLAAKVNAMLEWLRSQRFQASD